MNCVACHAPLPAGKKFCPECGARVELEPQLVAGDPLRRAIEGALGAQYDVVRLLGRGGMGAVYLARDRALERPVAIKVLPPDTAGTADALERFKREARTVASLTHPNIVPLYAFGEAGGLGYYVMGYVRGESLAARMAREGPISADETRRIMSEMADALDYAHRQGIIHRDIKPDNILLDDSSGRPMLTDFGIAKAHDRGQTLTQVGAVMGTPHFMSPEQASGDRALDGRSDLYSLGVVGWAMLAGRVPFEGKTLHEVLLQHVTAEAPPLAAVAPGVPEDLAATIARSLQKDPERRWPDGKSFRQALGVDLSNEGALSPELQALSGLGLRVLLSVVMAAVLVGAALVRGGWLGPFQWGWGFYPLVLIIGAVTELRQARKVGNGWRRITRVMWWQPRWWPLWWPRAARRPGDVTDRLPRVVRWLRVAFSVGMLLSVGSLAGLIMVIPLADGVATHDTMGLTDSSFGWLARWHTLALLAPAIGSSYGGGALMLLTILMAVLWGRRRKLGLYSSTRMAGAPAVSAFWTRAEIAPLLSVAAPTRERRAEPGTPHELLRSIASTADQLGGGAREAGSTAVATARELLAKVEEVEREIAELAGSGDAGEVARLEQRVAAMDAQQGSSDEQRRMRALVTDQLALMRQLSARSEAAVAQRGALVGLLRAIWNQLADARAQAVRDGTTSAETTARLRTLCAEIERRTRDKSPLSPGAGASVEVPS